MPPVREAGRPRLSNSAPAVAHRCGASPTSPQRIRARSHAAGDGADRGVGGAQPGVGADGHRAGDGDGWSRRARSSLDSVPDLTGPDADIWALTSETYGAAAPDVVVDPVRTTEMPVYQTVIAAPAKPFHFSAVMLCGVLAAIVALAGTFTTAVQITSDTRLVPTATAPADFRTGTWMLDDLADNMSIAILIAAVLLVIGGVAAGFRWNWGSGLAGGAGLALTGLVALAIGLAQFPIDAAREFAAIPNEQPFVLTITATSGSGCCSLRRRWV